MDALRAAYAVAKNIPQPKIYPYDRDEPHYAPNVKNIQASWLTVGKQTAQLCRMRRQ